MMVDSSKSPRNKDRFKYSITTKLVLVIILIIIGTTLGTILVIRQQVESSYQRFISEQFSRQVQAFYRTQEDRLQAIETLIQQTVKRIYAIPQHSNENFQAELAHSLIRLVDHFQSLQQNMGHIFPVFSLYKPHEGRIMRPVQSNDGQYAFVPAASSIAKQLQAVTDPHGLSHNLYYSFTTLTVSDELAPYELFVIPLTTPSESSFLSGEVILAFPLQVAANDGASDQEAVSHHGLYIGGIIHGTNLAKAERTTVANILESSFNNLDLKPPVITINGKKHQLAFKKITNAFSDLDIYRVSLFSLADLEQLVDQLSMAIILLMLSAMVISIIICAFIAYRVTRPVLELLAATKRISDGDYTVQVNIKTHDEIGALAKAFNSMTEGLRLKDKYRHVLGQVTDKNVADDLLQGEIQLGGEIRRASVLFCDVRDFTATTEHMEPEEVIAMLNEHMTVMTAIAHKHYGVVDKFIGDALMVTFGVPHAYGNDIQKAFECACEMIIERQLINAKSRFSLKLGIGVATGNILAGCMGSSDRLNYTVLGKDVNLAARLCSRAPTNGLLIDQTTYHSLKLNIPFQQLDNFLVRGFSKPLTVYQFIPNEKPSD